MVDKVYCDHCGAECKLPVTKTIDGRLLNFCCTGCLQVYELMHEAGVPSAVQPEKHGGHYLKHGTALGAGLPAEVVTLSVGGMTCANCVARVRAALRLVPGVLQADVNLATARATVEVAPGAVAVADLERAVARAGYTAEPV